MYFHATSVAAFSPPLGILVCQATTFPSLFPCLPAMCGILGIFGSAMSTVELRAKLIEASRLLRHRGPDWSGYIVRNISSLTFHSNLRIISFNFSLMLFYRWTRTMALRTRDWP